MDFERGIWQAALDSDVNRVRKFLDKGTDPNLRDGSGYTALVNRKSLYSETNENLFLEADLLE